MNESIQEIAAVSQEQAASTGEMSSAMKGVAESSEDFATSTNAILDSFRETTKAGNSMAQAAQEM